MSILAHYNDKGVWKSPEIPSCSLNPVSTFPWRYCWEISPHFFPFLTSVTSSSWQSKSTMRAVALQVSWICLLELRLMSRSYLRHFAEVTLLFFPFFLLIHLHLFPSSAVTWLFCRNWLLKRIFYNDYMNLSLRNKVLTFLRIKYILWEQNLLYLWVLPVIQSIKYMGSLMAF